MSRPVLPLLLLLLLLFTLLLLHSPTAHAASSPNFNLGNLTTQDAASMFLNPSAALTATALDLTQGVARQVGSAYYINRVVVLGLDTTFRFQIPPPVTNHEGFTFLISNNAHDAIGPRYSGLGYGDVSKTPAPAVGLANTLALEFDTFRNPELADPAVPHISVHARAPNLPNNAHEDFSLKSSITVPQFDDGRIYNARLIITPPTLDDAAGSFELRMWTDGAKPGPVLSISPFDLRNYTTLTNGNLAFVGFTSTTGETFADTHRILSWSYNYTGLIDPRRSTIQGQALTGGKAGLSETATLQAIDQFGAPITFGGWLVTAKLDNDDAAVTDNADGTFDIRYTQTVAGTYSLSVRVGQAQTQLQGSPWEVHIVPGNMNTDASTIEAPATSTAGEKIEIKVTLKDKYGNVIKDADKTDLDVRQKKKDAYPTGHIDIQWDDFGEHFTVSYTPQHAASYTLTIQYQFNDVASGETTTVVQPTGDVDPSECFTNAQPAAVVGAPIAFTLFLRDQYNNTLHDTPADTAVAAVVASAPIDSAELQKAIHVQPFHNGTALVRYQATVAGDYVLTLKVNDKPIGAQASKGAVATHWQPANAVASHCVASGESLKLTEPGRLSVFYINAFDSFGNHLLHGGNDFRVEMTSPRDSIFATVRDQKNGSYLVEYASQAANTYSVSITMKDSDGQYRAIRDSPFTLVVYQDQTVLYAVGFSALGAVAAAFVGYRWKRKRDREMYDPL